MYKVKWHPTAIKEYRKSFDWYLERSTVAAEAFLRHVDAAIANINKHLFIYKRTFSDFRENILLDFPFTIVFRVIETEELIVISAVCHQSRNPNKKYR